MSTRYGHSNVGGGNQDQGERKDEGWESRQGGSQSRAPGRSGHDQPRTRASESGSPQPLRGTNTQGDLAGIGEASRRTAAEGRAQAEPDDRAGREDRDEPAPSGTDQPPRMGGPLGPDPKNPHLPEGAQDTESRGTGAGGFDRGVNAKVVGAVHQGVREEDVPGGS
jgi:hypothetical protein